MKPDRDLSSGDVTSLLNKLADGDQEARDKLVPLAYQELRRLAARCLQHERANHTLQATALVHEAYIRLSAQQIRDPLSHGFFLSFSPTTCGYARTPVPARLSLAWECREGTSEVLKASPETIHRHWQPARDWLVHELEKERVEFVPFKLCGY